MGYKAKSWLSQPPNIFCYNVKNYFYTNFCYSSNYCRTPGSKKRLQPSRKSTLYIQHLKSLIPTTILWSIYVALSRLLNHIQIRITRMRIPNAPTKFLLGLRVGPSFSSIFLHYFNECYGSGMFIPDPTTTTKGGGGNFCLSFFCSHKFHKNENN